MRAVLNSATGRTLKGIKRELSEMCTRYVPFSI